VNREDRNDSATRRAANGSVLRRMGAPALIVAVLLLALLAIVTLFNLGPTGWPGRTSVLCCDTPGGSAP